MSKTIDTPETFQQLRKEYSDKPLWERDTAANPFDQFERWFQEACDAQLYEPNAMILSTVSPQATPSSRAVLFKGIVEGGFSFYTRYTSAKGEDIKHNPSVSLLFYWPELHRQVRIQGRAAKLSPELSDQYFHSRPLGAQRGAVASRQSDLLPDRSVLEDALKDLEGKCDGKVIPRPVEWGGYAVKPYQFEFWQGRRNRLHDRIVYECSCDRWEKRRLYP
jgi:pyridoxamine 5'-phosphate oxidase